MTEGLLQYDVGAIEPLILTVRGQRVILDADLARMYGVPTKALNQAVKRNCGKFPQDFAFQLVAQEVAILKSQIVTSSSGHMRPQIVTASSHGGRRKRPYAFTEHGAIMAASVLNSPRAVQMSVFVVRAFVSMRKMLVDQHDLARKLAELDKRLSERLDGHEVAITEVLRQIMQLLNPPQGPEPPPKRIGYHVKEKRATYHARRGSTR